MWIGEEAAKGYTHEDFSEVFCRYIPRSEVDALIAASQLEKPTPVAPIPTQDTDTTT